MHDMSYSQQVYQILKDFLPQVERDIRDQLDSKYQQIYQSKYQAQQSVQQHEINRRVQELLRQKELQLKNEYEKMYEHKVKELQHQNDQALKRFRLEIKEKSTAAEKDKQIAVLLQQKNNWEKLEKEYARVMREIGNQNTSYSNSALRTEREDHNNKSILNKSIEKERRGSYISPINTVSKQLSNSKKSGYYGLKIEIPRQKDPVDYSQIGSQTGKKDDNISNYSSLLSPPHIPHQQPKREGKSRQKRSLFWNQEKKKQLLDMIRKRII